MLPTPGFSSLSRPTTASDEMQFLRGWPTFTFFVKVGTTNPPISSLLNITFDAFPNWDRIISPSALSLTFRLHA
jgi:hypothetical protein